MDRIYLFDLDGTLTDPREGITKSICYALRFFGIEKNHLELTELIGPPLYESFQTYFGFSYQKTLEAVEKYREYYSETGIYQNRLCGGIIDLLKRLKERGGRLAVATSKPTVFAKIVCQHFGLSEFFDAIVGSELDGSRVVKKEVIETALAELHCDTNHVIMIGDRKHDIIGAKENNLKCAGVLWGYGSREELSAAGADYLANDTDELYNILLDWENIIAN